MRLAMVGLGRMGANMVRRLVNGGHECVVYDVDAAKAKEMEGPRIRAVTALDELRAALSPRRVVWLMVPAGAPTASTIQQLAAILESGDIVVDGGNSFFKDDLVSARVLGERGIEFVDCGTSGGVWGLERGYSLMLGGPQNAFDYLIPALETLAPGRTSVPRTASRKGPYSPAEFGFVHCGPTGSGHFVKMVHNGIEYGLMQAFAEGFDLLKHADAFGYQMPLAEIAEAWRRGSVVSSWLLDLTAMALTEDEHLAEFEGRVSDSGEGRWTVMTAVEAGVSCNVMTTALYERFRSRDDQRYAYRLLSAMRHAFGGHVEKPAPAVVK